LNLSKKLGKEGDILRQLNNSKPVWLEVNLNNLEYNIKQVKRICNDTLIMAIVKADAYGHGAITISKVFLENGADRIAVSRLSEAVELRKGGINCPIMMLNYTLPDEYEEIFKYNLIPSIYRYDDAEALSHIAVKMRSKVKIHIKIDTGMGRIGFLPKKESISDIIDIAKLPGIELEGIFTHFSSSDEKDKALTKLQCKIFRDFIKSLERNGIYIPIKHISNSAAVIDLPEYNLDMIRPGMILYGYYPSSNVDMSRLPLKPALALKVKISNIKFVEKGKPIGYNCSFRTEKDSLIGTLPIGFADGYFRRLSSSGEVCIRNTRAPIVGKICMDQFMVDVSHIKNVKIGDEAVLFGYENTNHPSVEEVAKRAETITDEIMCAVGRRVPRIYIKESKTNHIVDYLHDINR